MRHKEVDELYRRPNEFEEMMSETDYSSYIRRKLSLKEREREIATLLDLEKGEDGKTVCVKKRNAILAK